MKWIVETNDEALEIRKVKGVFSRVDRVFCFK